MEHVRERSGWIVPHHEPGVDSEISQCEELLLRVVDDSAPERPRVRHDDRHLHSAQYRGHPVRHRCGKTRYMRELPTGTVTFVFTDVEGSTELLKRVVSEAYGALLAGARSAAGYAAGRARLRRRRSVRTRRVLRGGTALDSPHARSGSRRAAHPPRRLGRLGHPLEP